MKDETRSKESGVPSMRVSEKPSPGGGDREDYDPSQNPV